MTQSQDSGPSSGGDLPDGVSPSDEHAEQWAILAEMLGASALEGIVSRVEALQQSVTALDDQIDASEDDGLEAVQEVREQLERLREQNTTLAAPSAADEGDRHTAQDLHPDTEALLDQLDAASLSEAQERVRSLTEQVDHLYREKEVLAEAGLMSSQEALDEIDRLQKKCDRLQSSSSTDEGAASSVSLPSRYEEIAEVLGVDSVEEARELDATVRRLSNQLEGLLEEKDALADTLGVSDAEAVLDLVQSMEEQLSDFYEAREHRRRTDVPTEIEDILGVSTVGEAEELASYVRSMYERLEQFSDEHEALIDQGLDAKKALEMIESMEDQLVDLYHTADTARNGTAGAEAPNGTSPASPPEHPDDPSPDSSVSNILGVSGPEEARELDRLVRRMGEELNQLRAETETLTDHNLTAESALQMIDSMEGQLVDLYDMQERRAAIADALASIENMLGVDSPDDAPPSEALSNLADQIQDLLRQGQAVLPNDNDISTVRALLREMNSRLEVIRSERDVHSDRAEKLAAMEDILGISTVEEARELTSLVQNLDAQLQSLYAEREKLGELGLSSVEDAVDMIQSMEHQLQELYEEQEALEGQTIPDPVAEQDTFEQLQGLYREQEKLKRALGVSDADEVIEMVEDLTAQLDDLYTRQESDSPSPDDVSSAAPEAPASSADAPEIQLTLDSMRHQLEMLYAEREVLLRRGIEGAEEAVARIDDLREKHEACQERMARIEAEVGTTDPSEIAEQVAETDPAWSDDPSVPLPESAASDAADDDPFADAGPSLLPDETLSQLDEMSTDDLDALPVGVLRLGDDGTIRALNEKGRQFPGLGAPDNRAEITGTRLFERVPGTSNALFLGRFKNGVQQGEMDARFPYTFVTPGDRPTVFFIHLYRNASRRTNWLLFRPA